MNCPRLRQVLAGLLLITLISGCTPLTRDQDGGRSPPADLAPWTARGKLAITAVAGSQSASFHWHHQSANRDRVRFSGPLGLGAILIVRDGKRVYWQDGDRARELSELAGEPAVAQLLADLPYSEISQWLTAAGATTHQGWTRQIDRWQTHDGWQLPRRMTLTNGDISLRIAVSAWELP